MAKRKLYHTSPSEIDQINDQGRFGSSLFFSYEPYFMTTSDNPITYELETEEEDEDKDYLDVNEIPYLDDEKQKKLKPILNKIKNMTGLDDEEALDLLSERTDIYSLYGQLENYVNYYHENDNSDEDEKKKNFEKFQNLQDEDLGELSWDIQKLAGKAAKALGYKGAKLFDEQGVSYLIDMLGREKELKKSSNEDRGLRSW